MPATTPAIPGYETTFITKSELTDEAVKAIQDKITNVVGQYGGEIVMSEDWGKRKLAYTIQKETRGRYTYLVYTGKGEIVQEVERNLRLTEPVMRFLTVNLAAEFDAEKFKKQRLEITAAAKKREEEREARREERMAERRGYEGGGGYDRDRGDRGGYEGGDRGPRGFEPREGGADKVSPVEALDAGSDE